MTQRTRATGSPRFLSLVIFHLARDRKFNSRLHSTRFRFRSISFSFVSTRQASIAYDFVQLEPIQRLAQICASLCPWIHNCKPFIGDIAMWYQWFKLGAHSVYLNPLAVGPKDNAKVKLGPPEQAPTRPARLSDSHYSYHTHTQTHCIAKQMNWLMISPSLAELLVGYAYGICTRAFLRPPVSASNWLAKQQRNRNRNRAQQTDRQSVS